MAIGKLKARFGGRKHEAAEPADAPEPDEEGFIGPSPNPKTNLILADLALRGSGVLVRQAMERGLLGRKYAPEKAKEILKGRTFGEAIVGSAIAKIATRSVPGAILVGGGLLAKTLYDRRKGRLARDKGELALERMAENGAENGAETGVGKKPRKQP